MNKNEQERGKKKADGKSFRPVERFNRLQKTSTHKWCHKSGRALILFRRLKIFMRRIRQNVGNFWAKLVIGRKALISVKLCRINVECCCYSTSESGYL